MARLGKRERQAKRAAMLSSVVSKGRNAGTLSCHPSLTSYMGRDIGQIGLVATSHKWEYNGKTAARIHRKAR